MPFSEIKKEHKILFILFLILILFSVLIFLIIQNIKAINNSSHKSKEEKNFNITFDDIKNMKNEMDYLKALTIKSKEREDLYIPPEKEQNIEENKEEETLNFSIQLGSFKIEKEADSLVAILKKMGYPTYKKEVFMWDKGKWFRVRVGDYKEKELARVISNRLKNELNLNSFITTD
jgi:cell division protein YceG involved in septum cleavage